jgi:hypothetical protein
MLACCSPKIDLLAIVDLVALGENQVLIAASPLSLIGVLQPESYPHLARFYGDRSARASICTARPYCFMADSF